MLKLIELRDTFGPEFSTVVRILVFCSVVSDADLPDCEVMVVLLCADELPFSPAFILSVALDRSLAFSLVPDFDMLELDFSSIPAPVVDGLALLFGLSARGPVSRLRSLLSDLGPRSWLPMLCSLEPPAPVVSWL